MARGLTENRKLILKMIQQSKKPLLVKDIYEKMPSKPDLSTVYRALDYLVKNNLIKFVSFIDNVRLYFADKPHVHFIYCLECKGIEEFDECFAGKLMGNIQDQFDFKIKDHFFYFTGICKKCRA